MVEWKKLGEVCKTITPPKKLEKELYGVNGAFPIIDQGQKYIVGYTNDETSLVPNDEYILFGDHTRYVKYFNGSFAQGADGLKILKAANGILPRYFFFSFENVDVPSRGYSRHWSIAKELIIPIPSLEEQARIVGILDTFTSAIDNLKEQIAQRRKQYEYYRDQLLDLEGKEGVEMKTLGEACEIRRGIRVVKKQLKDNALYPVFQNSIAPMGYYDQFNRDGNIPYIICAGSSSGSVGFCCTPFWAADDCYTIESSKVNRRYTYYALKKNNNYLFKLVRKGSMPRLPHEAIDNMIIPIPSLSEQSRIVSILDTFEASIQNLEAQLKEREKQYEYYRNKLLTFERDGEKDS